MFSLPSSKDKALNPNVFDVSTKEVLSDAENKEFYTKFNRVKKVTFWIGLVGQTLSGATEFIFFFLAAGGSLPITNTSNILPVLLGAFMVFLFEYLGVNVYLVSIVRQTIALDFKTKNKEGIEINSKQKIALYVLNISFCACIMYANFYTSITGQAVTVQTNESNINNSDTLAKIDSELMIEITSIRANTDTLNDKAILTTKQFLEDVKTTYSSIVTDLKNSKWVKGANVKNLNSQIIESNEKQVIELRSIKDNLNVQTTANNAFMNESIALAKQKTKTKKEAIKKTENSDLNINSMFDRFSLIFLVIFMSLSIFAVIYKEIYISGSKQKVELKEVKNRPILIIVLMYGLYMHLYRLFYWIVVKIVGSKAYDYSKIMQQKTDYLSIEVSPIGTEIAAFLGLGEGVKGVKPAPISFGTTGISSGIDCTSKTLETQRNMILNKYNLQTVATWYKRSNLAQNNKGRSNNMQTRKNNEYKYLEAKKELLLCGAKFSESSTNVSITI